MAALQTVYIMAFTPEKMDKDALMGMCQAASQMLSSKNRAFAECMSMLSDTTRMTFSNQLHVPTIHTPQVMQTTFAGWLQNENRSFAPRIGGNFFPHGMRDTKGRENYILVFFDFK